MIRHYYHVYADGDWRDAVTEHLAALEGLAAAVTVGIVGSPQNRRAVRQAFEVANVETWVEAAGGWEQVTLGALRRDLAHHDDPVLYAHTKGAAHRTRINDLWRRSMTALVVDEQRADLLAEHDAVGCHWLTPGDWPNLVDSPYFGGNFWWATAAYLRTLPPLAMTNRYDAEQWIGLGNPRVADLLPGWPDLRLFAGDGAAGSCHHGSSCPQSQALMNPAARLSTQTTR